MNTRLFLVGLTGLTLLAGCGPAKPKAEDVEKEVQRRVEERLAEERRVQQEQQLAQREQQLADREKQIADREAATVAEQERQAREAAATAPAAAAAATATPEPAPEPAAIRGVQVPDDTDAGTAQTFYDDLDPYGDWIETRDYGYVFRPNIAFRSSAWRPYEDGRWVYTDDGWAWVSNEPFGWATYHYGRWTRLRGHGWIWVPGSEWAPAWVSWRYGDDYCGWAPLPPEARFGSGVSISFDVAGGYGAYDYVFVPTRSLCESSIRPFVVDRSRNVTIINKTVNVTHIERTRVTNKTVIINRGPRISQVEAIVRKPVPRLKIEHHTDSLPGSKIQGDALQVSVPATRHVTGQEKPRRVKEKIGRVEVERDTAATTAAATATPPSQPTVTPFPAESPLDAQRKAIEQEQARQKRLAEQQKRGKPGATPEAGQITTPKTENVAGGISAKQEPTPEPQQTSTPQEAQRKAIEQEQLRQRRIIEQQQIRQQHLDKQQTQQEQEGQRQLILQQHRAEQQQQQAQEEKQRTDAIRQQREQLQIQQRQAGQEQLRQQRSEEQRAQEQQAVIERQRAQAERGQELQQRRLERQQQEEQQQATQEQRRQEIQMRQQAAQEAAAQRSQQRDESRQQTKESRKRGKSDENTDENVR